MIGFYHTCYVLAAEARIALSASHDDAIQSLLFNSAPLSVSWSNLFAGVIECERLRPAGVKPISCLPLSTDVLEPLATTRDERMDCLRTEDREGVTHLVLSRPQRGNALDVELVEALHLGFDAAEAAPPNAMIIRGDGANFCTGFDLSDAGTATDAQLLHRFVRIELLLQRCYRAPFPTAAVAHGRAFGAGADLFAACDLRFAVSGASFAFPGAGFGLVLGTGRLAARTGADQARALVWNGKPVDARQALEMGLANYAGTESESWAAACDFAPNIPDHATFSDLRRILNPAEDDAALAALVRSAARPGLAKRIADYRGRSRAQAG